MHYSLIDFVQYLAGKFLFDYQSLD